MDKYLITINIPILELKYDVYIPINKKVGTVKKKILESLKELSDFSFDKGIEQIRFIDRETGEEFNNNTYIKDSKIKNGSQIIMM